MAENAEVVNTSGFQPLGYKLLVLPAEVSKKTESGLYLAESFTGKEEMAQIVGTVVAVGEACWADAKVPTDVKAGDQVLFAKYAGILYTGKDAKKYRIVNDLEIVGRII